VWASSVVYESRMAKTKLKLFRFFVMLILLYGCESWMMNAETTRTVLSFETKCFKWTLGISWRDRNFNDFVWSQITLLAGPQEPLLAIVKRRKLSWFGTLDTSRATTQCPRQSSRAH
jgi:hypothetical protein